MGSSLEKSTVYVLPPSTAAASQETSSVFNPKPEARSLNPRSSTLKRLNSRPQQDVGACVSGVLDLRVQLPATHTRLGTTGVGSLAWADIGLDARLSISL